MSRYRKKPVVIDAYEFHNRVGPDTRPSWLLEAVNAGIVTFHNRRDAPGYLTIDTLEGQMRANAGDWIIRGIAGEIYPCKPDIFAATYEPAPNTKDQTMGDPKEALERLQIIARHFESRGSLYARCVRVDHLSALIAEREGLEREVERLTKLAKVQTDFALLAVQAREAAESKLSALSEVVEPLKNAFWALGYLVDDPRVQRVLDADERLDAMTRRNFAASALRAILHPTVPVENNT